MLSTSFAFPQYGAGASAAAFASVGYPSYLPQAPQQPQSYATGLLGGYYGGFAPQQYNRFQPTAGGTINVPSYQSIYGTTKNDTFNVNGYGSTVYGGAGLDYYNVGPKAVGNTIIDDNMSTEVFVQKGARGNTFVQQNPQNGTGTVVSQGMENQYIRTDNPDGSTTITLRNPDGSASNVSNNYLGFKNFYYSVEEPYQFANNSYGSGFGAYQQQPSYGGFGGFGSYNPYQQQPYQQQPSYGGFGGFGGYYGV